MTINPPFDLKPYIVTEVKDIQLTAMGGGEEKRRNTAKVKLVKERPVHLQRWTGLGMKEKDRDSEAEIQLGTKHEEQRHEQEPEHVDKGVGKGNEATI